MSVEEEVDKFLQRNTVDSRAAAALRAEAQVVQKSVLDRGDLHDCLNPSAALMGRINVAKEAAAFEARKAGGGGGSPAGSGGSSGSTSGKSRDTSMHAEVEEFIKENKIDDVAARALLEAGPGAQRSVLGRGGLTDCRNPSAVCLARLREAKIMQAMKPSEPTPPPSLNKETIAEEIEKFLERNTVDLRAASALRAETPATQRAVLDRGDLHDCQNPSAALMGRISVAKETTSAGSRTLGVAAMSPAFGFGLGGLMASAASGAAMGGMVSCSEDVEGFISENRLDGSAALALRQADALVQKAVVDRGSLTDCRDPSAVCLSRIRDAKSMPHLNSAAAFSPCMGFNPYGMMFAGAHAGTDMDMMTRYMMIRQAYMAQYAAYYQQMAQYSALAGYGMASGQMDPAAVAAQAITDGGVGTVGGTQPSGAVIGGDSQQQPQFSQEVQFAHTPTPQQTQMGSQAQLAQAQMAQHVQAQAMSQYQAQLQQQYAQWPQYQAALAAQAQMGVAPQAQVAVQPQAQPGGCPRGQVLDGEASGQQVQEQQQQQQQPQQQQQRQKQRRGRVPVADIRDTDGDAGRALRSPPVAPQEAPRGRVPPLIMSGRFADLEPSKSDDCSMAFVLLDTGSSGGIVFEDSSVVGPLAPQAIEGREPVISPRENAKIERKPKAQVSPPPRESPKPKADKATGAGAVNDANFPLGGRRRVGSETVPTVQETSSPGSREHGRSRYEADFQEISSLGKDGFGAVTKVRHIVDRQVYVIKRIPLPTAKRSRERLLQESALLPQLTHLHIVRYYQAWTEVERLPTGVVSSTGAIAAGSTTSTPHVVRGRAARGRRSAADATSHPRAQTPQEATCDSLFLQMEFCEGGTLRDAIDRGELARDQSLVWKVFRQVLDALAYMHSRNLIHRDLKPTSIFLSRAHGGLAKLGNFGLTIQALPTATQGESQATLGARAAAAQTISGGTCMYFAPELSRQSASGLSQDRHSGDVAKKKQHKPAQLQPYDERTDMFSLGVVFFEMWHPPFADAEERVSVMSRLGVGLSNDIFLGESGCVSLEDLIPLEAPPVVKKILRLLLARKPEERMLADELLNRSGLLPGAFDPQLQRILKALENPSSTESVALIQALFARSEDETKDVSFFEQLFQATASFSEAEVEARDSTLQLLRDICRRHNALDELCPLLRPLRQPFPEAAAYSQAIIPSQAAMPGSQLVDAGNTLLELRTNLTEPFARAAAAAAAHAAEEEEAGHGASLAAGAIGPRTRRRYHMGTVYREAWPPDVSATSTRHSHPREVSSAVVQFQWWPPDVQAEPEVFLEENDDSLPPSPLGDTVAQVQELELLHLLSEFVAAAGLTSRAELHLSDTRLQSLLLDCAMARGGEALAPNVVGGVSQQIDRSSSLANNDGHGGGTRTESLRGQFFEALRLRVCSHALAPSQTGELEVSSTNSLYGLGGAVGGASGVNGNSGVGGTTSSVRVPSPKDSVPATPLTPVLERAVAELASLLGGNSSDAGKPVSAFLSELEDFLSTCGSGFHSQMRSQSVEQLREIHRTFQTIASSMEGLLETTVDALQPIDTQTYGPGIIFRLSLRDGSGRSTDICAGGRIDRLLARFARLHGAKMANESPAVGDCDQVPVAIEPSIGLSAEVNLDNVAAALVQAAQTTPAVVAMQAAGRKWHGHTTDRGAPQGKEAYPSGAGLVWWRQAAGCWAHVLVGGASDDSLVESTTGGCVGHALPHGQGGNGGERSGGTEEGEVDTLQREVLRVTSGLWRLGVRCEVCPRGHRRSLDLKSVQEAYHQQSQQVGSSEVAPGVSLPDFVLVLRPSPESSATTQWSDTVAAQAGVRYSLWALSELGLHLMKNATKEVSMREFEERLRVFEFFERLARRLPFKHMGLGLPQV
eukprot:TRINITY_DN10021_c0_g2_i1.p1 TRINITY_DN10021_c0_g2~~TRINITY_DN10021_c0_g2_i1.p1  ORF type:complete len:1886 (-),score=379.42 TRINITY_DN10021_c0_g2_i1:126-5783(-)